MSYVFNKAVETALREQSILCSKQEKHFAMNKIKQNFTSYFHIAWSIIEHFYNIDLLQYFAKQNKTKTNKQPNKNKIRTKQTNKNMDVTNESNIVFSGSSC